MHYDYDNYAADSCLLRYYWLPDTTDYLYYWLPDTISYVLLSAVVLVLLTISGGCLRGVRVACKSVEHHGRGGRRTAAHSLHLGGLVLFRIWSTKQSFNWHFVHLSFVHMYIRVYATYIYEYIVIFFILACITCNARRFEQTPEYPFTSSPDSRTHFTYYTPNLNTRTTYWCIGIVKWCESHYE